MGLHGGREYCQVLVAKPTTHCRGTAAQRCKPMQ
jgi:hypothetical protein